MTSPPKSMRTGVAILRSSGSPPSRGKGLSPPEAMTKLAHRATFNLPRIQPSIDRQPNDMPAPFSGSKR